MIDDVLLDEVDAILKPSTNPPSTQNLYPLIKTVLNTYAKFTDSSREFAYQIAHALLHRVVGDNALFVQPTGIETDIIGEGSFKFSTVHRAKLDNQVVVVKVIKNSYYMQANIERTKSFLHELKAWKDTPLHANLLPLLGVSIEVDRGRNCVLYSLVSPFAGKDLLHYPISSSPLWEVRDIFLQVAGGLEFLHTRDAPIVHGNVRASNILIDGKRVVLADFGLAKACIGYASTFTLGPWHSRMCCNWLAPELLQDICQMCTPETDIYAFACTVIEAFTRQPPPFEFVNFTPSRPGLLMGNEWNPFWELLSLCLAKKPEDRPSASKLVACMQPLFRSSIDRVQEFLKAYPL